MSDTSSPPPPTVEDEVIPVPSKKEGEEVEVVEEVILEEGEEVLDKSDNEEVAVPDTAVEEAYEEVKEEVKEELVNEESSDVETLVKEKKPKARKRKKRDTSEDLPARKKTKKQERDQEEMHERVNTLLLKMREVHDKDLELVNLNKPALEKLSIIKEVEEKIPNSALQKMFIDAGVLNELRRWMTPLPDKSLPNIRVREAILKVLGLLNGVHINPEVLKSSGIGKFVRLYSIHPQETKKNRDSAEKTLDKWKRAVYGVDDVRESFREPTRRAEARKATIGFSNSFRPK